MSQEPETITCSGGVSLQLGAGAVDASELEHQGAAAAVVDEHQGAAAAVVDEEGAGDGN